MKKKKLLIIDDQWKERNHSYEFLLNDNFLLDYLDINNPDELSKIDNPDVDAIIVDIFLGTEKELAKERFTLVLDYINDKRPIILISSVFNEVASWITNPRNSKVYILDYYGWMEIFNPNNKLLEDDKKTICFRIEEKLNNYYKRTLSKKKNNEKITILHISDLQYGDKNFTEGDVSTNKLISDKLIELEIRPDLVLITGDFAYEGLPSEFIGAAEWINRLCKLIFPRDFNNYHERILLVPGNHDINFTLSAAEAYKFDKNAINGEYLIIREENLVNENLIYGFLPFCEFAFGLTKDYRWIENENKLCWINDKFINWGVRFVHLNTVSEICYKNFSDIKNKNLSICDKVIKNLIDNVASYSDELFTIFLGHNSPNDFGYDDIKLKKNCINLFGLINALKCNLYCNGHIHKQFIREYPHEGKYTSSLKYIGASTLNLNSSSRPGDSRKGFNIIELSRENGKINKEEINKCVKTFEFDGQRIYQKPK